MGTMMSKYIHDNANHDEQNLCRLFMAMRPTGPVAIAFAEIYLLLNRLTPGQTVKNYCQNVLGYDTKAYNNTFTSDEQKILGGHWDPKFKDVSLLFKLLHLVCGLSQDDRDWEDPENPLEFHLHTARNVRNDAMYDPIDVTDEDLQIIFQELDDSIGSAINLAGERVDRDVHYLVQNFKSDLQSCLNMNFKGGFIARTLSHPNAPELSYLSGIVMYQLYRHCTYGYGDGVSLTTVDPGTSLTSVAPSGLQTALLPYTSLVTGSAVVAPGIMTLAKVAAAALLGAVGSEKSLAYAIGSAASLADTATAGKLSYAIKHYNGSPTNTTGVKDIISLVVVTAAAPLMYITVKYYKYTQIREELGKYLHEAEALQLTGMSKIIQRQLRRLYLKKNVIR